MIINPIQRREMKMKAQMKAIMASAVVIALCLAAVGGVTYSWFSDSDNANVDVTTAVVDLDIVFGEPITASTITSMTKDDNTYGINYLAANFTGTIPVTVTNNSTIKTVFRMTVEVDPTPGTSSATLMKYDADNITINEKTISNFGYFTGSESDDTLIQNENKKYSFGWNTLNPREDPSTTNIEIATPDTYGDNPPENWMSEKKFSIIVTVEAFQGDYDPAEDTPVYRESISAEPSGQDINLSSISTTDSTSASITYNNGSSVKLDSAVTKKIKNSTNPQLSLNVASPVNDQIEVTATLTSGGTNLFTSSTGGLAEITIVVPGDYSDATIIFNGTYDQPIIISADYDGSTSTTIVFTTTHFSSFTVSKPVLVTTSTEFKNAVNANKPVTFRELTLDSNVVINNTAVIVGNCILDLNGYNIESKASNGTKEDPTEKLPYGILNMGILTINDSTASGTYGENYTAGKVYTTNLDNQGRHAIKNIGILTINDGMFGYNGSTTTDVNRGNAIRNCGLTTINGGYFSACQNYTQGGGFAYFIGNSSGTITINDGYFHGMGNGVIANDGGNIIINGGKYILQQAMNGETTVSVYGLVYAPAGKVTINAGSFERNATKVSNRVFTDEGMGDRTGSSGVIEISKRNVTITNMSSDVITSLNSSEMTYINGYNNISTVDDYYVISYVAP